MISLWGEEFTIQETPKTAKKIIKKIQEPKTPKVVTQKTLSSKNSKPEDKLPVIAAEVDRILGSYKENTLVIKDYDSFVNYVDNCIANGVVAVDTETNNSLDPISCKLMGLCLYTLGQRNAYIPVNHVDVKTKERFGWQITEEQINQQLQRLFSTKIVMHNGKFDYQVIKKTCGIALNIYWDTMIAARILDENEKRAGLKEQYIDKIDYSQEKYDIEHLFQSIEYAIVDPSIFALYAATDSYMTYKLYEWQLDKFKKPDNSRLLDLFMNIEMPVVEVAAEMELTGICIDKEYAGRLSKKYHKISDEIDSEIQEELKKYQDVISKWRLTEEANYHPISKKPNKDGLYLPLKSKNEQLKDPIEVGSTTQLAILLYDIFDVGIVDKNSPRGTGEDILSKMDLPICKLILKKRGIEKLLTTYIDKIPACVSEVDGRLHAHFNQIGAGTGRFSSSDPNLQNIPSHNKSIRMMFTAGEGMMLVGADFSQQEPRLMSMYSQDENMIGAYKSGKDLYATMGMGVYHNDYWDNMEKHQDGSPNPDGKKRRSNMKTLLLGIMYGMGPSAIAEDIGCSVREAEDILNNFYNGFPKVKNWKEKTEHDAQVNGYVEDFWGRRRRLPDIQLPKYTVKSNRKLTSFNPIIGSSGKISNENDILIEKYHKELQNVRSRQDYQRIKSAAEAENITIIDNGGFISQAQRQCVNARIQGGAASMSKLAMRKVYDDPILKKYGFKILLQIHDELIGECPEEYVKEVENRLTEVMRHSAEPIVTVPFKCDGTVTHCWYEDDFGDIIREEYQDMILKGDSSESAYHKLKEKYDELSEKQLNSFIL